MPLSGHSVGTYPETSSHATCQKTFGHSRLSSHMSWHKESNYCAPANLHFKKKKKKAQAGNEWSNILPKSWQARGKATTTTITTTTLRACGDKLSVTTYIIIVGFFFFLVVL